MSNCNECVNLKSSIYMQLENETLYTSWCDVGNVYDKNCSKYEKVKGINTQNRKSKGCKSL